MLRSLAPQAYDRAMTALRQGTLALLALLATFVAVLLTPIWVPTLGMLLATVVIVAFALRWWQRGLIPRRFVVFCAGVAHALLAGTAVVAAISGMFLAAGFAIATTLLLLGTARHAVAAWQAAGPIKPLLNMTMLRSLAGGLTAR